LTTKARPKRGWKQSPPLDAVKITHEHVPPGHFLGLTESERANVKRAVFIAPELGSKTFGSVRLDYRFPRLKRGAAQ
jgi:hypothetical protein